MRQTWFPMRAPPLISRVTSFSDFTSQTLSVFIHKAGSLTVLTGMSQKANMLTEGVWPKAGALKAVKV